VKIKNFKFIAKKLNENRSIAGKMRRESSLAFYYIVIGNKYLCFFLIKVMFEVFRKIFILFLQSLALSTIIKTYHLPLPRTDNVCLVYIINKRLT